MKQKIFLINTLILTYLVFTYCGDTDSSKLNSTLTSSLAENLTNSTTQNQQSPQSYNQQLSEQVNNLFQQNNLTEIEKILTQNQQTTNPQKINVNVTDASGVPLIHKAVNARNEKLLDLLIEQNVDINAQDPTMLYYTVLHIATSYKDLNTVNKLLNTPGINVNIRGKNGATKLTALELAINNYNNSQNMKDIISSLASAKTISYEHKTRVCNNPTKQNSIANTKLNC